LGTGLKPAHEPIVMARKPIAGTVASNVIEFGTGARNVSGCSIPFADRDDRHESTAKNQHGGFGTPPGGNRVFADYTMVPRRNYDPAGRHPANVILTDQVFGDGPSRFFYVPKASPRDRCEGSTHPTVKPIELMRHLIRLVTRPRGLVLDPFAGSGTTGLAADAEGVGYLLVEREPEFIAIAERRLGLVAAISMAA
jgi:hypothetical protein